MLGAYVTVGPDFGARPVFFYGVCPDADLGTGTGRYSGLYASRLHETELDVEVNRGVCGVVHIRQIPQLTASGSGYAVMDTAPRIWSCCSGTKSAVRRSACRCTFPGVTRTFEANTAIT